MYTGGANLGRNETGYKGYLRSTGRGRPNPGAGYCATAWRQCMGLPSLGDAYELPRALQKRGWEVRKDHVHPYDTVVYSNKPGSTYRGYSERSKRYFGHVGWAVPDGSGGLMLWSYLSGKWQMTRLGDDFIALYDPGE